MEKVYETERLMLRILDKTYAEVVLDYYLRNRTFLQKWEPLRDEKFYTKEYQQENLEKELTGIENNDLLRMWIFKKNDDRKIIGTVCFNNIVKGAFLSCHLGYKLDKDEINNGYMTEAVKRGIDIIFDDFKLHRIEANIMPRNKPSLKVVEKLGFYNEGIAYKYLKINGKWEDHVHMVLLNDNV